MKVEIEIDESQYGLLCKPEEVEQLFKALRLLSGMIWAEAFYDPYNESTQKFARRLDPHMEEVAKIIKFKK